MVYLCYNMYLRWLILSTWKELESSKTKQNKQNKKQAPRHICAGFSGWTEVGRLALRWAAPLRRVVQDGTERRQHLSSSVLCSLLQWMHCEPLLQAPTARTSPSLCNAPWNCGPKQTLVSLNHFLWYFVVTVKKKLTQCQYFIPYVKWCSTAINTICYWLLLLDKCEEYYH